jgi:hypothetical protein
MQIKVERVPINAGELSRKHENSCMCAVHVLFTHQQRVMQITLK